MPSLLNQSTIWEGLVSRENITSLTKSAMNPCEFQVELKRLIDTFYSKNSKIIEVGCFTGITSLILDDRFDKTLLDLNGPALKVSEELFNIFTKRGTFITADMFNMPFADDTFDIVFNSGVLEHFDYTPMRKTCGLNLPNTL